MQILYVILEINKPKSVFVCLFVFLLWLIDIWDFFAIVVYFFELFVQSMKESSFSMSSMIKKTRRINSLVIDEWSSLSYTRVLFGVKTMMMSCMREKVFVVSSKCPNSVYKSTAKRERINFLRKSFRDNSSWISSFTTRREAAAVLGFNQELQQEYNTLTYSTSINHALV